MQRNRLTEHFAELDQRDLRKEFLEFKIATLEKQLELVQRVYALEAQGVDDLKANVSGAFTKLFDHIRDLTKDIYKLEDRIIELEKEVKLGKSH